MKAKKVEIKFLETTGDEPYIQELLKTIAERKKIPLSKLQKELKDGIKKEKERLLKSKLLGETMAKNVGETVAYQMLDKYLDDNDLNELAPFDEDHFLTLTIDIETDIPALFPLKNAYNPNVIPARYYVYDPDEKLEDQPFLPKWATGVKTASCSPDAQIVFNKKFMQKLLLFGKIKGLKTSSNRKYGEKYASNGGKIPDEYAYIEFLIAHELFHYVNGDFYFEKAMKLDGTLVNWVGDFVTNYDLVKNEYPQLPMGLFNEKINYDHYTSWVEMYKTVKKEMEKLEEKGEAKDFANAMNNAAADDMPGEGEGFEPPSSQKQNQKNQDSQRQEKGQGQDGQSKRGKEVTEEDFDKLKEIDKIIKKRMEEVDKDLSRPPDNISEEERWEELAKAVRQAASEMRNNGGQNRRDGRPAKIEFVREYKPTFNWREVIKKLIPSKYIKESTYSRASTMRIGTFVGLNKSLGISSMPAGTGTITIKNPINFCIIWDSSFSVETINEIKKELLQIFKMKSLDSFILIKVNNNEIKFFNIDLKLKNIVPFYIDKNKIKNIDLNFEFDELFKNNFEDTEGIYNTSLQDTIKFLRRYKPNNILLTNSNFSKNTKELTTYRVVGRHKFGIITSNKEEYIKLVKVFGDFKNMTYIKN